MKPLMSKYPDINCYMLVTLVFMVSVLLMMPLRNQAFDDDFSFILTTERLVKTGSFRLTEWTAMSMIFQPWWGYIFSKIFGYSIKTLHLSNIILFYIAVLYFFALIKRLVKDKQRSVIFTFFLIGFPWVFNYLFSFMTDIFYMSLTIISMYFYVRAIQDKSIFASLLGSIFAGFAFLNRQIGVTIPIAACLTLIIFFLNQKRYSIKQVAVAVLPFLLIVTLYFVWINQTSLTALQYKYEMGPSHKLAVLQGLWPIFNAGHTSVSSSYYIQTLQRLIGYYYQIAGFLFPTLLIFIFPSNVFITNLWKENRKTILILTVFTASAYIIDHMYKQRYSLLMPDLLHYDPIIPWSLLWTSFIILATPFWIVATSIILKRGFYLFFIKKIHPNMIIYKSLLAIYILWISTHFLNIYSLEIKLRKNYIPLNIKSLHYHVLHINWDVVLLIFQECWFFFLIISLAATLIIYLITHYHFSFSKIGNPIIFFIAITGLLEMATTIIGAYYYWNNYVNQFIPCVLLIIAYFSRLIKISYRRAILVICFMLFVSISTTRNRYQPEGASWEAASKLLETGISPDRISPPSWAWLPFWYFEDGFNEAVKEYPGNKYDMILKRQQPFWPLYPPKGDYYEPMYINKSATTKQKNHQLIVVNSQPYWIFFGNYQVAYVKKINE